MKTRETTEEEKEIMEYLNNLRDSGATNMFGARYYIMEEFGIDKVEAKRIYILWRKNFNEEGIYETVKDEND